MSTHYETLGVTEEAEESEIKRAWARLVRQHTPDQDPEGNRRLNEAKATLLDPRARADYDAQIQFGDEIADLFDQAHSAMIEEDYGSAVELFKEILAFHPGSLDARNQLALGLAYLGNHDVAVRHLERIVEDAPDSALYISNLGHVLRDWGSYEPSMLSRAENCLRKATELESYNASHHVSLSKLYRTQKRFAEAEVAIENAIAADGKVDFDDLDSLMELTWIYLFSDQKEKIPLVADRVKAILPDDDETKEYASFLFVRTAVELAAEFFAFQDAACFIKAARRISPELGELQEAANSIERRSIVEIQADALQNDQSIHPAVMPAILSAMALSRIGIDLEDDYFEQLCKAAESWPQDELRTAAVACSRKYPQAYAEVQDVVDQIVGLGQPRSFSNSQSYAPRSSGGGCAVLILAVVILTAVVSQF